MSVFDHSVSPSQWPRPKRVVTTTLSKAATLKEKRSSDIEGTEKELNEEDTVRLPQVSMEKPLRKPPWKRVNRHERNVDPDIMGATATTTEDMTRSPYLILSDEFAETIGHNPRLDLIITDERAPYFHGGGVFLPRLSTLYLTSNLLRDPDPAAVSSANRRTELTRIEFFSPTHFARDKVRYGDHSRMAVGAAEYPNGESSGIVVCVQGSLKEASGLHGRPLNSPCDIVSNPTDGSLFFTDPAYGWERGFRPKPQLPSGHIYRFDPESGECRVVANGHSRPAGLALWQDTLYISELGDKHGGTTIFAYTISTTDPFRAIPPTFQISVSNRTGHSTSNHKSTPSNSTIGSQSSSSGQGNNSTSAYAFNRTAPLPAHSNAGEGSRNSDGRGTMPPGTPTESNLRSPLLTTPSRWHFHKDRNAQRDSNTYARKRTGPHLVNKRLFAYTPSASSAGLISADPRTGNLFLGTEDGVEVFSAESGEMIGKIVVDEAEGLPVDTSASGKEEKKKKKKRYQKGVSKVAFGLGGEFWLLGGERVWRGMLDWGGVEGLV